MSVPFVSAIPSVVPTQEKETIIEPPTILPPPRNERDVTNPLLFECAWEVANKVGGIYTVIKTKVPVTVAEYGDRYCLIGPLSYKTAPMEVESEEPTDPHLAGTLDAMRSQGVKALYGRWLIEGNPHVLLFDTGSQYHRLDEWKGDLWSLAGIPSPPHDQETNETIILGYLVTWFLGEVRPIQFIKSINLISLSMYPDNSRRRSLPISTNGKQASLLPSVESVTSMSQPSSQHTPHFLAAISAQEAWISTTIFSILTSITRQARGASIIAIV